MMKNAIICFVLLACSSCGDMRFYLKDELNGMEHARILIGDFITRDLVYDPFLADNLKDSLRFAFFRNDFDVSMTVGAGNNTSDIISNSAALCSQAGADLLITGIISRKEIGSFSKRDIYFSVLFIIRNKKGEVAGEAFYSDNNVEEPCFIENAADSFVSEYISWMIRRR